MMSRQPVAVGRELGFGQRREQEQVDAEHLLGDGRLIGMNAGDQLGDDVAQRD